MSSSNLVYKQMLQNNLEKINKKIRKLQNNKIMSGTDMNAVEIEKLRLEAARIKEEIANYSDKGELGTVSRTFVETFDGVIEAHDERREEVLANIEQLKELRERVNTRWAARKINRQITHQQNILNRLKKRDVRINGLQRTFMISKLRKENLKQGLLSKAQAKVNVTEAKYNDIKELQSMLNPDESIKDSILNTIYEVRGKRYFRKNNHAKEVLTRVQESGSIVAMSGANAIVMSKRLGNKLRDNLMRQDVLESNNKNRAAVVR